MGWQNGLHCVEKHYSITNNDCFWADFRTAEEDAVGLPLDFSTLLDFYLVINLWENMIVIGGL